MNMYRLGVSHSKDLTCGLKGGSPGESPPDELLLGEFPNCPPFNGWRSEPLGILIGKLVITCTMVGTDAIIGC